MDDRPLLIERDHAAGVDADFEDLVAGGGVDRVGALPANDLAGLQEQKDVVARGRVDQAAVAAWRGQRISDWGRTLSVSAIDRRELRREIAGAVVGEVGLIDSG